MIGENLRVVAHVLAAVLALASLLMPWAALETPFVHVRYTATSVRACAGEFCHTVDWPRISRLAVRTVLEQAANLTHLDTIQRSRIVDARMPATVARHPLDIVSTVSPAVLPILAVLLVPRKGPVPKILTSIAAALFAISVIVATAQISPHSSHIGAGIGVAVLAVVVNVAATVAGWIIL